MQTHPPPTARQATIAIAAALATVALGTVGTGGDPEVMALRLLPVLLAATVVAVVKTWHRDPAYRWGMRIAAGVTLLLFWAIGATSFMGTDDLHPADMLYLAVPAVGIFGAVLARFRPRGMTRTMVALAAAHALAPMAALAARALRLIPGADQVDFVEIAGLSAFFALPYLGAAWLFHRAGTERNPAGVALGR